jgi:hypothetical protein
MDHYSLTDEATVSRIADTTPRAMSAYFLCLHKADLEGRCEFSRDEIINEKVRSWTRFKNDIRALSGLFLLNFLDQGDLILVELIPQGLQ